MAKYVFKFQSIMKVKEMLEKKVQEEISRINKEIDDLMFEMKHIGNELKRISIQSLEQSSTVADFKSMKMYESHLRHQIESIEKKINMLNRKKDEKQLELIEKKREIKSLEIIKENDLQNFLIEERKNELKALNEVALRNFNGEQS